VGSADFADMHEMLYSSNKRNNILNIGLGCMRRISKRVLVLFMLGIRLFDSC